VSGRTAFFAEESKKEKEMEAISFARNSIIAAKIAKYVKWVVEKESVKVKMES